MSSAAVSVFVTLEDTRSTATMVSKLTTLCHVKRARRLVALDQALDQALDLCARSARQARRAALLAQLTAAAMAGGCTAVCTCSGKFDAACAEVRGQVMRVGEQHMCVAADGMVIATWIDVDGGGVP